MPLNSTPAPSEVPKPKLEDQLRNAIRAKQDQEKMSGIMTLRLLLVSCLLAAFAQAAPPQTPPQRIAGLIDPAKLATLAVRGANPRVQKYVAQLEEARLAGFDPTQVTAQAVALTGMTGDAAQLTLAAMLRNLTIAERLGCLTPAGLHDMRRGQAPTITLGPYAGDQLSVDHIIPFAVVPSLDSRAAAASRETDHACMTRRATRVVETRESTSSPIWNSCRCG